MGVVLRVRKERVTRGLSQVEIAQLASEMGSRLSQGRLSQIERGLAAKSDERQVLSGIFGVAENELFNERS